MKYDCDRRAASSANSVETMAHIRMRLLKAMIACMENGNAVMRKAEKTVGRAKDAVTLFF
ncbi:MAG: hypothetical protein A2Y62_06730 [Candidatus Fischerbacteria bacterium RBG_13_37_8]|uniref:Uncharacterized protein n=1 Tax=Candidatus Fischerbacteria bacterium RBG_13_37_8 TaxID=1817863 RepID=A0A1F5VM75_9BACT|nr:MAG: hypothetical protein A2Y62_06730 [Candidatus Fischerbacteria bacterium RBG_13_37_8]